MGKMISMEENRDFLMKWEILKVAKKKMLVFIIVIIIILMVCLGCFFRYSYSNKATSKDKDIIRSSVPTVFVHGSGSSYHAEQQMADYAKLNGVTNTIVRANVSRSGKVTWIGNSIKKDAQNPIIEVNLVNNKSVSARATNQAPALGKSSIYIKDVLISMQKKYHFTKVNLVGHSMGNLQIAYYLCNNTTNIKLPKLQKQVSIAGHYDGYIGELNSPKKISLNHEGRPNKMDTGYRGILSLREKFPSNARVLNIYGNTGGGSDGSVTTASAKSYRYLVSARARSYQEKEIYGEKAQHSNLHENIEVDRILVKFLWGK